MKVKIVYKIIARLFAVTLGLLLLPPGCSRSLPPYGQWQTESVDAAHEISLQADGETFQQAGPIRPQVDVKRVLESKQHTGLYLLVPGDVVELEMPAILRTLTSEYTDSLGQVEPYVCRVSVMGTVTMPIVGEIAAAGQSLAQLEQRIVNSYYPRYMIHPPMVVGRVRDYHTASLTILGAVSRPGLYACNGQELSLVSLIMKAGGIVDEGAGVIRIRRAARESQTVSPAVDNVVLPVKGLNIPFADVSLRDGDVVEVDRLDPAVFTVIGLVNRNGTFPYPPGVHYNLLQALAFAGGVNDVAAPRYARIYRQGSGGEILSATFRLKGSTPVDGPGLEIRPGDVVAVEHDVSTRTRLLLAQIFRVTAGVNVYATYRMDTSFEDETSR